MEHGTHSTSEQTKRALADALKEKMASKPIEKITIQELTDLCGIRRQNFYYHFEDIYALLCWTFQEEALPLLEEYEGVQLWQEGILCFFRYLEQNRKFCASAIRSSGREYLKRFFEQNIQAIVRRTAQQIGEEVGVFRTGKHEDDVEMMTCYYAVVLVALSERWVLGEIDRTPEQLVAFMDRVIGDHIRGAKLRVAEENTK